MSTKSVNENAETTNSSNNMSVHEENKSVKGEQKKRVHTFTERGLEAKSEQLKKKDRQMKAAYFLNQLLSMRDYGSSNADVYNHLEWVRATKSKRHTAEQIKCLKVKVDWVRIHTVLPLNTTVR